MTATTRLSDRGPDGAGTPPAIRDLGGLPPWDAACRLCRCAGFAFLDSGGDHGALGRWSIIGIEPFGRFAASAGQAAWNGAPEELPPLEALRARLADCRMAPVPGLPFAGGAIGHIDYEFRDGGRAGGLSFGFYDLVLVFDRAEGRAFAIASDTGGRDPQALQDRLRDLLEQPPAEPGPAALGPWSSDFDGPGYAAAVERVRAHIRDGDIYQANISQAFRADFSGDPWALYAALRRANPAPFAAWLSDGEQAILSASPERYLELRRGKVEARPIKGTLPRHPDPERDRAAALQLAASEKDRAENVMIVDLMRNDISRVCRPGTVEVPELCTVESYASVHHLTSAVTGRLAAGEDAVSLIAATFPGGSITGAPKERAMQIIRAIEGRDRGVYCGAIGYLGFDGDMDLNIPIRTVMIRGGEAVVQAGGGVTLLSEGMSEYSETLDKAARIFDAFAPFAPDPA
ncbi:aminodeoxychorismate synthase component I [Poseidonocella sp. HB161398]|uniref:aminodeoxychorismate synthase component I n=1 Tax=Poseidonocella sp. HB161398 TaxID=2320855 RepID=UPI001107ACD1|nr:aminodeoxychorismate synthase component I [Poseidonocella sp. HB161398]